MAIKPPQNRRTERRSLSLGWALALSVLVHLLLVLLGGWLPLVRLSAASEPEETVLKFSFADAAETDEASTPEGDVPFETSPAPDPVLTPPMEQREPQIEQPEEERAVEPIDAPIESENPSVEEILDPVTPELPVEEREPTFAETDEADEATNTTRAERPGRAFDLDGAIQDFGRVLDRARADAPRPESSSGPPRNVFVPDPAELNTTGYGLGNLTFETADFDWSDYARAVYAQIWRAWHNRLLRTSNEFEKWAYVNREPNLRHANQVRFVIERSGQVTGIMVEGPSGCNPLDNSATQALAEVILPPLPDAFPKEREVVHAQFIAIGEIRYMKPVLTRMKALNYF